MKRIRWFPQSPEFYLFLFCLALLLYIWPLITIIVKLPGPALFIYLLTLWSGIVFILALNARSAKSAPEHDDGEKKDA